MTVLDPPPAGISTTSPGESYSRTNRSPAASRPTSRGLSKPLSTGVSEPPPAGSLTIWPSTGPVANTSTDGYPAVAAAGAWSTTTHSRGAAAPTPRAPSTRPTRVTQRARLSVVPARHRLDECTCRSTVAPPFPMRPPACERAGRYRWLERRVNGYERPTHDVYRTFTGASPRIQRTPRRSNAGSPAHVPVRPRSRRAV